jgi:glyoxylase-like metal-dependent hydrolase (beta-lactamase superfamily II)
MMSEKMNKEEHVRWLMPGAVSRRGFIAAASSMGVAAAFLKYLPLPALAESLAQDARIGTTPLVDKGFATIRKIGDGVYATISDPTKGFTTLCNGGFIFGKEGALLIEGFASPAGAAFQTEALAMVSQAPVRAAINTHYHFDHSFGNAYYGANGFPLWAHTKVAPLMVERYASIQGKDKTPLLDPFRKKVELAANELEKQHAQGSLQAATTVFQAVDRTVLTLPNRPLLPSELPMKVFLGAGTEVVIDTYPGHTPGDIIVRIPAQNIVFTGDLLFNGSYPATFDADMAGYRATAAKFAAFDKDTIFVPGHGQVCGQEGVALERAVFDDLAEHAQKMAKTGVSVEEAQKRYTVPEKFSKLSMFAWSFCVDNAVAQFYAAAKAGKL